tara:strand:+ start:88 stop:597 length:510 start_codon:yes stop_codon:yes gene_type:complete
MTMVTFILATVLFVYVLPKAIQFYIASNGVTTVINILAHRSDVEYLKYIAFDNDALPCSVGQVYPSMLFRRAMQSTHQNILAADFKDLLIRTRVHEVGAIKCYEGEEFLGSTHTVSLERKRKKDVEFVDAPQFGKSGVSGKDVLTGALVWYSTLPYMLFSTERMMGYRK